MSSNKLVSILIPCYNSERWLAETLKSALDQTWQNIEIILVDDGSTDNSLSIARSYESSRLKVIAQENRGASSARNRALKEAQGDFIQYLDADDLLNPKKIEAQVLLLQQNESGILGVCGTIHFFDGQTPNDGIYESGFPFIVDSDDPLDWLLRLYGSEDDKAGMVPLHAWLTPRHISDAAGLWNEQISLDDDGEYFARVVLASKGIRRSDTALSYYRRYSTSGSLSAGKSESHYLSALRSTDLKAKHIFVKTDSPIAKRVLARSYMDIAIRAYPDFKDISDNALIKVAEMGGADYKIHFVSWKAKLFCNILGWQITRRIQQLYIKLCNVSCTKSLTMNGR